MKVTAWIHGETLSRLNEMPTGTQGSFQWILLETWSRVMVFPMAVQKRNAIITRHAS